jgi:hypothetical protein
MSNRFNYRCPKCGSADDVVIDAYLSVWLDGDRPHLIPTEITANDWYATNRPVATPAITPAPWPIFKRRPRKSFPFTAAAASRRARSNFRLTPPPKSGQAGAGDYPA